MLYAITTYFNPFGYQRRKENYQIFRKHLHAPLITIELGFDSQFDLQDQDAEILVQVEDGDVLFQKERLLNHLITNYLPDDCQYVAWFDCDVVLERDDWADAAAKSLSSVPILQLMSNVHRIESSQSLYTDLPNADVMTQLSFGARYCETDIDLHKMHHSAGGSYCRSGLAWAARRDLLAEVGLYDALVIGSGDRVLPNVICGAVVELADYLKLTTEHFNHFRQWCDKFEKVNPKICGVLAGSAIQLWHGDYANRRYEGRHQLYRQCGFDPTTDLRRGSQGAWRWSNPNSLLAQNVYQYFQERQEDGIAVEME